MNDHQQDSSLSISEQGQRRALIYIRSATREQVEPLAAPNVRIQYEACRSKAKQLGAVVAHEYSDLGVSGLTLDRAALKLLMQRLKQRPHIDYVIVHRLDRLTRRLDTNFELFGDIKATGATLVSCSEDIAETPSSQLLRGMTNLIADFYGQEHSRRMKEGLARKRQRAVGREAA